ncbi:MAG: hypothetical protein R3325_13565 [Thermoanaerobaculia bacterium]|nr:hypothetical protein [Thermoanaerobaculia bacterium]
MTHSASWTWRVCLCCGLVLFGLGALPAQAQGDTCPADFCDEPVLSLCDGGGFLVTLVDYQPAPSSTSGFASYTYEICSPQAGTCVSTVRPGESCLDNNFCRTRGQSTDPAAYCTRTCSVDSFRDLSHYDVGLPVPGQSCLSEGTAITGSCTGGPFSVGPDGSCGSAFVAKCDAGLAVGNCYQMTISIAGELNSPGLGAAFQISKESTDCNESCIAGPSCDPCDGPPVTGEQCLTRTRGFWGTHPHLIQSSDPRSLDLLPVTVCGTPVGTVQSGYCSTSEALCTSAADRRSNPTYLTLAAQLTAAKLNLAATSAVTDGEGTCDDWLYEGQTIQQWISYCEAGFCGASKQAISGSGCIEALDDFNNSQDVGFDETPFPFDAPGPALTDQCQLARGNGKWVGGNCVPAP